MPSALSLIITVLVTTSLVAWLRTEERKSPRVDPSDGSLELRHGRKYLFITVGSTLFAVSAILLVLSMGRVSGLANILGLVGFLIAFLIGGTWMALDAVKTRVVVSSQGVLAITPLGGERRLKWSEIRSVSYNPWAGWLTLRGDRQRPVRVNRHLVGTDSLIKRLRENLGTGVFRGLAQALAHVGEDAA